MSLSDKYIAMLKKIINASEKIECTFTHEGAEVKVELEDKAVEYIRHRLEDLEGED